MDSFPQTLLSFSLQFMNYITPGLFIFLISKKQSGILWKLFCMALYFPIVGLNLVVSLFCLFPISAAPTKLMSLLFFLPLIFSWVLILRRKFLWALLFYKATEIVLGIYATINYGHLVA